MPILRGMNSESVELIYLDPPFNSNANYAVPIGSKAAGAEFKDTWTLQDVDIAWLDLIEGKYPQLNRVINAAMSNSDKSYLIYMAVRLLEMHRVLKPTGSIYLHCDPTMSHYLKLLLDAIFGRKNFRNEIVWCYAGGGIPKKDYPRKTDIILRYTLTDDYIFHVEYKPYGKHNTTGKRATDRGGTRKIEYRKEGTPINNWWSDIRPLSNWAKERVGYPTQKPLTLLDRIIKASSNEGDMVLDPFCGCATACVAAERLQREWIGIDISPKAAELVVERIKSEQGFFEDIVHRTDVPKRTDIGDIPRYNASANKKRLYGEQDGYCNGCRTHFESRLLEVDHIIATSVGGTDHIDNLQLLCSPCNRTKGNRGQEYLLSRLNPA